MFLTRKGLRFADINVSGDDSRLEEMERLTGSRSVPQILINDRPVGGFDELRALDKDGGLQSLVGR
jgi:glutaredoxin 3